MIVLIEFFLNSDIFIWILIAGIANLFYSVNAKKLTNKLPKTASKLAVAMLQNRNLFVRHAFFIPFFPTLYFVTSVNNTVIQVVKCTVLKETFLILFFTSCPKDVRKWKEEPPAISAIIM